MKCRACDFDNPTGMKFCGNCAAPLSGRCPKCGFENPPGFKFCGECAGALTEPRAEGGSAGASPSPPSHASSQLDPRSYTPKHLAEKILTSRSALEGERKQVTVLFADVKGSLELAEQIDPEEWHKILNRFFEILTEGVHRFEGTVNQYTGDGIMALFGAPIAHEDHAQRACYAALHLRDELRRYANELRLTRGLNFSVRMGLNSGEVIVGKIGDDLRMDYTAQGHTVGLAARMEQLAEAGKIYLTEHTASLVAGFFRMEGLGPVQTKGAREPVGVFELQGVGPMRTRLDVSRARGLTRFVGREHETTALENALAQAIEGSGQVVGIVAEPGVGKSRICFEFLVRCRARGIAVYESHCVAHGKAVPFLPVLEMQRAYFGITDQDGDQEARRKIAGTLLLLDEAFRDELPLVFEFLGVPDPEQPAPPMDPDARQRRLLATWRRVVEARSRRQATVLLVEDLHWIDGGSETFLASLAEAVPGTRTLLLLNFRPEYQAAWMRKSYYHQLPLLPLGPEAIGEMLHDLLGGDPSVAGLAELIRERTGGNPFFMEEIVRSLVESGPLVGARGAYRLVRPVEEVAIPGTVQAILAARIDRLPEREKATLQAAAVIGREFSESVLSRVAGLDAEGLGSALRLLTQAEFLHEQALYPEAVYAFQHPLTQEVAYRSQLTECRARAHAAVAGALPEIYPDKLDEQAALLAHHWEEAGEYLRATWWSARAARWVGRNDHAEALPHWRKVRALLRRVPESEETARLAFGACRALLGHGSMAGISLEEAEEVFAEGKILAQGTGHLRGLAMLVFGYATVRGFAGEVNDYVEYTLEAVRIAEQANDAELRVAFRQGLIASHFFAGRLREALAYAEEGIELAGNDAQIGTRVIFLSPLVWFIGFRGMIFAWMGRLEEGRREADRAIELARQLDDVDNLCWILGSHAQAARFAGEPRDALLNARRAVEIAEKRGSSYWRVMQYTNLGEACSAAGEWGDAVAALEHALALVRQGRANRVYETVSRVGLADALLGRGEAARARAIAEEALAEARCRGMRMLEHRGQLVLARALLRTDGLKSAEAIESALTHALSLVEETGARADEPFIHLALAELAGLKKDEAARERELREAQRLFSEMGAPLRAEQVAKEIGA